MKFLTIILVFLCLSARSQDIKLIKFADLEQILNTPSKETLVVNFWATFCAPCIKELPEFEELHKKDSSVRVLLVSLDFADKVDKVKNFVGRKRMKAPVVLLDDVDYNSWIDKVDPSWSGAIPATLIINSKTGQRKFVGKELAPGELEKLIDQTRDSNN